MEPIKNSKMLSYNVYVNQSQCFACGVCEDMCPRRVFKLKPTDFRGPEYEERIPQWMGTITEVVAEDMCFGCRICENQCPVGVIEVKAVVQLNKPTNATSEKSENDLRSLQMEI
jgi:NAD-dependent dihydropyrimidine dehydrogenase PreA subunit